MTPIEWFTVGLVALILLCIAGVEPSSARSTGASLRDLAAKHGMRYDPLPDVSEVDILTGKRTSLEED